MRITAFILCVWILSFRQSRGQEFPGIQQLPRISTFTDTQLLIQNIQRSYTEGKQNSDKTIKELKELIYQSGQAGFSRGVQVGMEYTGELYALQGDYDESLQFFRSMYLMCTRNPQLLHALPTVFNAIANIYKVRGHYRDAARYYYQGLALYKTLNGPVPSGGYNNLGAVLIYLKQYDDALYYLNRAEEAARKAPVSNILITILNNKGVVFMMQKNWAQSRAYLDEALDLATRYDMKHEQHISINNFGFWNLLQGKNEDALMWFFRATDMAGDGSLYNHNATLQSMARAYFNLGHFREAENYLYAAMSMALRVGLRNHVAEINQELALVYEGQGSFKKSLEHYRRFISLRDSLSNERILHDVQLQDKKFRIAEHEKDLAQKALQISRQQADLKLKNILATVSVVGSVLILIVLVSVIRSFRSKARLQKKQLYILRQAQQIERLNALMQGEENERLRLARELHDGIGGMLAAVKMTFTTLQQQYEKLATVYDFIKKEDFVEIRSMLDQTSSEVRKTAHNLMPDILVDHGLHEALKLYCEHINNGNRIYIKLQFDADMEGFGRRFELALYRIIQELLQNILKHAEADNGMLHINRQGDVLKLVVKDNGIGFNTEDIGSGIGLRNLRDRVQALHGQMLIHSETGKGCRIHLKFDLNKVNDYALYEDQDRNS